MRRYSAGNKAHILFSVGITSNDELEALLQRLNQQQMQTADISGIEAAQVRHHTPFLLMAP